MPTAPTPITALPAAPSTSDPSTFSAKADALLGALVTPFVGEANAVATNAYNNAVEAAAAAIATAADADATAADRVQTGLDRTAAAGSASTAAGWSATSTTSMAVGTGPKSLTVQTGKQFGAGTDIKVTRTSAPTTTYMGASVDTYDSGTGALTFTVSDATGSGTYTDWTVRLSGARGTTGTGVTAQAVGFTLTGGTTAKTLTVDADATVSVLLAGNVFSAVADGAITEKTAVALTDAGKLKAVAIAGETAISGAELTGTITSASGASPVVVPIDGNTFALLYGRSSDLRIRVATVAGTALTWGAEASFGYGDLPTHIDACYNSALGKIITIYAANGSLAPKVCSVALSGTTATVGTPLTVASATTTTRDVVITYDPVNDKCVMAVSDASSGQLQISTATASGVTLTQGTVVTTTATGHQAGRSGIALVYDVAAARTCLIFITSTLVYMLPMTLSGTSITKETETSFTPGANSATRMAARYAADLGRIVLLTSNATTTSNGLEGSVLTYAAGSYTASARTTVAADTVVGRPLDRSSLIYDDYRNSYYVFYATQTNFYMASLPFTVTTGGVFTVGTADVISSTAAYTGAGAVTFSTFRAHVYHMFTTSGANLASKVFGLATTNAASVVGLAATTVADGATVALVPVGTKATGLSGLSAPLDYFVTSAGALTTTDTGYGRIGKAVSATELLITHVGV